MKVYIITRDEEGKPIEIVGCYSEYPVMEEAQIAFYLQEENPLVEFDTHEWDIN